MDKKTLLVTCASWEDRFLKGVKRVLEQRDVCEIKAFYYQEYCERSQRHRSDLSSLALAEKVALYWQDLSFEDPIRSWHAIVDTLRMEEADADSVVLDLSTAPREMIFVALWALQRTALTIECVYHRPQEYSQAWLSRDPGNPRIVLKMGGLMKLGIPTALLIQTGFDVERVHNLLAYFEPLHVLFGIQGGGQYDNVAQNMERFRNEFASDSRVKMFTMDAYGDDAGEAQLWEAIKALPSECNIVLSSLGPKIGAVGLYHTHMRCPEAAVAYTPSREFNPEYSRGIGESIWRSIRPREVR